VNDDPDGDGISALLEYALNLDPDHADADRLPQAVILGNELSYTYPKDTSKLDISYQVEVSTDLKTWTPEEDTLISTEGVIENRRVTVPIGETHHFVRLKVTRL
ncbi:MAG: hypothetical protein ACR2RV_20315, partial [Verrucomicrobiales bacterium]